MYYHFVEVAADPHRVWCPKPGCETIVHLKNQLYELPSTSKAQVTHTVIERSRPIRSRRTGTTVNAYAVQQSMLEPQVIESAASATNDNASTVSAATTRPAAKKMTLNLKSHADTINESRGTCRSRRLSSGIETTNNDSTNNNDLSRIITAEESSKSISIFEDQVKKVEDQDRKTSLDEGNMIKFIGGKKPYVTRNSSEQLSSLLSEYPTSDVNLSATMADLQSPADYRPLAALAQPSEQLDLSRLNSVQSPAEYRPLLGIPEHVLHTTTANTNSSATCPTCYTVFCPLCGQTVHSGRPCSTPLATNQQGIKQQYKKLVRLELYFRRVLLNIMCTITLCEVTLIHEQYLGAIHY